MENKQHPPSVAQTASQATAHTAPAADAQTLIPDKQLLQQTLMDSIDVMQLLHICRGTLYNWRKQGMIASSKVGGRIYFESADVHRMIRERKQPKWNSAA